MGLGASQRSKPNCGVRPNRRVATAYLEPLGQTMKEKYKKSLTFWAFVSIVLLIIPLLLFTFDGGIEKYYQVLQWTLIVVFGPGVPIYLIFKMILYCRSAKYAHQRSNKKFVVGIILMSFTTIIWSLFLVNLCFFSQPGGGEGIGFAFSIIPLLLIGGIGETFAKSGSLNQKMA